MNGKKSTRNVFKKKRTSLILAMSSTPLVEENSGRTVHLG